MKILYVNPIFLDYRIPFYIRLNELFNGNFYVLFSKNRYINRLDSLYERIMNELGSNAISFDNEYLFNTYERSFKKYNKEKGKRIPFTKGLFRTILKFNPDILITEGFFQWTPLVILYSVIKRKPVIMGYERTCYTERNTGWIKRIHRKITDKFIAGYLVNGSETKKYLLTLGINENKIFIGGMSADSEGLRQKISLMSLQDKLNLKRQLSHDNGLIYLYCGQIVKRKGVGYLLDAWIDHIQNFPNDTLLIIGGGDLLDGYRKQYKNIESIKMLGSIDYTIIHKFYAIADIFVIPTIEDNWSLVVPEAMACGLPIATSIYNGCHPELVRKDVNGITFDTYNKNSIVESLSYFHDKDLKKMGQNSIKLEEPFNIENSTERVQDAIIKIYNNSKAKNKCK